MYICIKTKTHCLVTSDDNRTEKETQFIGFGELEELNELVEDDITRWKRAYKEFAKEESWLEFDKNTKYRGELLRHVVMYYSSKDIKMHHTIDLQYLFIDQNTKMFYID